MIQRADGPCRWMLLDVEVVFVVVVRRGSGDGRRGRRWGGGRLAGGRVQTFTPRQLKEEAREKYVNELMIRDQGSGIRDQDYGDGDGDLRGVWPAVRRGRCWLPDSGGARKRRNIPGWWLGCPRAGGRRASSTMIGRSGPGHPDEASARIHSPESCRSVRAELGAD